MADTVTITATATRPQQRPEVKQPRLWNVVLLNDDDHSYEYVIEMLQKLFGTPIERAFLLAKCVDTQGRAVCMTTHRELGELKVEQIHTFGRDARIASCAGSMSAVLEPADSGDDDDESDGRTP
ncbi:MAG: ATP-dependent Clp protease adaptor ClpS [Planctomycetota bacterium]|nr:ATP-dependent Clp protease adaptor ClpS [Planctomycetota bacterium]